MPHKIEGGETTILISKQDFMEKASKCVVKTFGMFTETIISKMMAVYLAELTYQLFDEEEENNEDH